MDTKTTVISQEQLQQQFAYCDKTASIWASAGRVPTAYVETYGCQQNEADSEKLRGYLTQSGYSIVSGPEGADVVVMNTCAIRTRGAAGLRQTRRPDPHQAPPPGTEDLPLRLHGR